MYNKMKENEMTLLALYNTIINIFIYNIYYAHDIMVDNIPKP